MNQGTFRNLDQLVWTAGSVFKCLDYNRKIRNYNVNFAKKIYLSFKSAFLTYFTDNIIFLLNGLVPLLICVNIGDERQNDIKMVRNLNIIC